MPKQHQHFAKFANLIKVFKLMQPSKFRGFGCSYHPAAPVWIPSTLSTLFQFALLVWGRRPNTLGITGVDVNFKIVPNRYWNDKRTKKIRKRGRISHLFSKNFNKTKFCLILFSSMQPIPFYGNNFFVNYLNIRIISCLHSHQT